MTAFALCCPRVFPRPFHLLGAAGEGPGWSRRSHDDPTLPRARLPTEDDRSTTTLASDELIVELDVPHPDASVYLKAMDRRRWAFALIGVAAARFGDEVRFGLAGVAPIP